MKTKAFLLLFVGKLTITTEESGCLNSSPGGFGILKLPLSDIALEVEEVDVADVVNETGTNGQPAANIVNISFLNSGAIVSNVVAEEVVVNFSFLIIDTDQPRPLGIVVVEALVVERVLVANGVFAATPIRLGAEHGSSVPVLLLVVRADILPSLPLAPMILVFGLVAEQIKMSKSVVACRMQHGRPVIAFLRLKIRRELKTTV